MWVSELPMLGASLSSANIWNSCLGFGGVFHSRPGSSHNSCCLQIFRIRESLAVGNLVTCDMTGWARPSHPLRLTSYCHTLLARQDPYSSTPL